MSVPFVSTVTAESAHESDIYCLQSSTRYTVAASGDGYISVWDNSAPSETRITLNQQPSRSGIHHLAVSESGDYVVAVSFDSSILAYSLLNFAPLDIPSIQKTLSSQGCWDCAVAGSVACFSTLKGSIFVVNLEEDTVMCDLKEPGNTGAVSRPCLAVDITADKQFVVGSYELGRTRVFSIDTHRMAYILPSRISRPRCVRFSPSGNVIAITGDESVALFTLSGGSYLGSLLGHSAYIYSIAFEPSGERLISVAGDGTAKVWSLVTREAQFSVNDGNSSLFACVWMPPRSNCIAGAPAGFAVAGVDGDIRWYREATGSRIEGVL